MPINLRAFVPLAQGLGAYRKGQMQGEGIRRQREIEDSQRLFGQWAQRRQLDLQQDRTAQLYASQEAAREAKMAQIKTQADAALQRVKEQQAGATARTTLQHGENGSVDRTNDSRTQQVRITVDGANRRDNLPVQLPDGSYAMVDAQGRAVPLGGTPLQAQQKPAGGGARGTMQERGAAASVPGLRSAYERVAKLVGEDGRGFAWSTGDDALQRGAKTPILGALPNAMKRSSARQYEQAMAEFESTYLVAKGGKTVTPFEEQVVAGKFRLQPNDPPFIRAQKVAALRSALEEIEAFGGKAGRDLDDEDGWLQQHRAGRKP